MKSRCLLSAVVAVVMSVVACGGAATPPAEQTAGDAAKAAGEAARAAGEAAGQPADTAAEAARSLEKMAQAIQGSDQKTVEPVGSGDLIAALPEVPGWTRGTPEGERMTSPVAFADATVEYTKDGVRVEVKFLDSGFNQVLFAPFMLFMSTGYEKQSSSGYERAVKIGGHPGWEKWSAENQNGEIGLLVNQRFVVTFNADGVSDGKILRGFAERYDLKGLVSLK